MNINQLLHNYLFELKKKLEHLPFNDFGTTEFTKDEINRVQTAINQGDPNYKHKQHTNLTQSSHLF